MIQIISKVKCQMSKVQIRTNTQESGQIVLILVLLTVVGLTIGLSLIARTITDIRISSQIEESNKAFSAAEAGVESALKNQAVGPTGSVKLPGDAIAEYTLTDIGGTDVYSFPVTEAGKSQTLWLVGHNSDGTINEAAGNYYLVTDSLKICWGPGSPLEPAIVFSLIYKEGSDYKISKKAYDSDSGRASTNGFNNTLDPISSALCGGNYSHSKTVTFADFGIAQNSKYIYLKIQPVYNSTGIGVQPAAGTALPSQGKQIVSIGSTQTGVIRKIQVVQGYYTLPEMFDFALFNESN
jgi:hypothetical protein